MGEFDSDAIYDRYAPTIETRPPLRTLTSIKYNGSYWIACGQQVVKSQSVSNTYTLAVSQETEAFLNDIQINQGKYELAYYKQAEYQGEEVSANSFEAGNDRVNLYTQYKNEALARSKFTFNRFKQLNQPTVSATVFTLHTMAKSFDGRTWKLIEDNPFARASRVTNTYSNTGVAGVVHDLAWNGTSWLAVGNGLRQSIADTTWTHNLTSNTLFRNQISMSTDGDTWSRHTGPLFGFGVSDITTTYFGVASSSSLWIIVGTQGRKQVPNTQTYIYGCAYRSVNGIDWDICETPMNFGKAIAYNGALWVSVGGGTTGAGSSTVLMTSSNGIVWSSRIVAEDIAANTARLRFNDVAWNGTQWLAVGFYDTFETNTSNGGFIATSTDGVDWAIQQNTPGFTKCVWDGNQWMLCGYTLYSGTDGTTWTVSDKAGTGLKAIGVDVVLPILGGTINTVSSLSVGYGQPSSVVRSFDSINWRPQTFNTVPSTLYAVIWSGSKWFIVKNNTGSGINRNALATSTDGLQWTFPQSFIIEFARGIAYKEGRYVAVGGASISVGSKIQTSTDGNSWTTLTCPIEFPLYVAHNSSIWVMCGEGGIAYSSDGLSWTASTVCPLTRVNCVAWNGYIWIAVGVGAGNTIATSIDGIRWYADQLTSALFTDAKFVAWNRRTWIAVGSGEHTIATSVNGINWIGLGRQTFSTVGIYITWDGTRWIAGGLGGESAFTSTDGLEWTPYSVGLEALHCFANKTISLPYIGVENNSILENISQGVSTVSATTTATVLVEQAAAQLAADQSAAAAAAAATLARRNASKASATVSLNRIVALKNQITAQYTPLLDTTYFELVSGETLYFLAAQTAYDFFVFKLSTVQLLHETIYNDSNSQEILDSLVAELAAIVAQGETQAIDFYENARISYKTLIDAAYDSVYNSATTSMLAAYGSASLTNFYNIKAAALAVKVGIANDIFDTPITNVNTAANLATTYSNVVYVNLNETKPATYTTDSSNAFTYVYTISRVYPVGVIPFKTQANTFYENALVEAEQWSILADEEFDDQVVIDDFNSLFTTYFYTLNSNFVPDIAKLPIAVKLFQNLNIEYTSPGQYPVELGVLYQTLKTSLDTVASTKDDAIAYTRSKIDTIIKDDLDNFKAITRTNFAGSLDSTAHLKLLLAYTQYSDSNFITSSSFAYKIGLGSLVFSVLFPLIQNVRISDAEAELDGATPPITGWGTSQNNLPAGQRGSQGLSGWTKFNETYFTRQKLADHVRVRNINGFVNTLQYIQLDGISSIAIAGLPARAAITWIEFLNFINEVTYSKIIEQIEDFDDAIDELTSQSIFLDETVDAIISDDVDAIQAQIVPAATAYIDSLLVGTNQKLPSEDDLEIYGDIAFPTRGNTLQGFVDIISTSFDSLQEIAATNLAGKTNNEILTLVNAAVAAKQTLNTTQNSSNYEGILRDVATDKLVRANAINFVETCEDNIARWLKMKPAAELNSPYPITISSGGSPFIMSILPTDEDYWEEHPYSSFIREDTLEEVKCTFNSETQLIETLPEYVSSDFSAYSSLTLYVKGDLVSDSNLVYECIRDNTPTAPGNGIIGILPTSTKNWKVRRYPYIQTVQGLNIEASPENLTPISPDDYYPYSDLIAYSKNDYVSYESSVYICISDRYTMRTIQGILPTNLNYWTEEAYPLVSYNGTLLEASPTNLVILDPLNFSQYLNEKVYYVGDVVRYISLGSFTDLRTNTVKQSGSYVAYLEDDIKNGVKGVSGESPVVVVDGLNVSQARWRFISYPLVLYEDQLVEATPGAIPQLNSNQYNAYSGQARYSTGTIVSYQSKLYRCTISTQLIKGVPVSNTDVWEKIIYPYVQYNGIEVQAIPGMVNPLLLEDYPAYTLNTTYKLKQIVSYEDELYECIDETPTAIPIINVPITTTTYWERRQYPIVYVDGIRMEANPADTTFFKELDPLSFVKYDDNWMYNVGDLTTYNGTVYRCKNVSPVFSPDLVITNISPLTAGYWTLDSDFTQSDFLINNWVPYKFFDKDTYVSFDGYLYKCETAAISQDNVTPAQIPFYWRQVTDFSEVGLSNWYDSSEEYTVNQVVMFRLPFSNLPYGQTHILARFKCVSISLNNPDLYAFDEVRMRDEDDEDGNILFLKISGTWNKRGLRRYGRDTVDPFRLLGYPRELRRRIAMEIEMPYGRMYSSYLSILNGVDLTFSPGAYGEDGETIIVGSPYFRPLAGSETLANSLRTRLTTVVNSFKPFTTNSFYTPFLTQAYKNVVDLLELRALRINDILNGRGTNIDEINRVNRVNNFTQVVDLFDMIRQVGVTQNPTIINLFLSQFAGASSSSGSVNMIKERYFNAIHSRIMKNPYPFMSPIALAQNPPQKLFRDLGVGDIDDITNNLDVLRSNKYTEGDREFYNEYQPKIDKLYDLAGTLSFESKRLTGFTTLFNMISHESTMGACIKCDSCIVNVPILTDFNYLLRESIASLEIAADGSQQSIGTVMGAMHRLADVSIIPPIYTLPRTEASRDLALLTWQSQDPFVQGLSAVTKGAVGLTISALQVFAQNNPIAMAINLVVGVDAIAGLITGNDSSWIQAVASTNYVRFQDNTMSILALRQQALLYRNSVTRNRRAITDEFNENILAGQLLNFGGLLQLYNDLVSETVTLVDDLKIVDYSTSTQIPRQVAETGFISPPKPNSPDLIPLKSLDHFKARREGILQTIQDIKDELNVLQGKPPSASKLIKPVLQYEIVNIPASTAVPTISKTNIELGFPFPDQIELNILRGNTVRFPTNPNFTSWKRRLAILESQSIAWNELRPPGQSVLHAINPTSLPSIQKRVPINADSFNQAMERYKIDQAIFENAKAEYARISAKRSLLVDQIKASFTEKRRIAQAITKLESFNDLAILKNDALSIEYAKDVSKWKDSVDRLKFDYVKELYKRRVAQTKLRIETGDAQIKQLISEVYSGEGEIRRLQRAYRDGVVTLNAKVAIWEDRFVTSTGFRDLMINTFEIPEARYSAIVNKLTTLTDPLEIRYRALINKISPVPLLKVRFELFLSTRPKLASGLTKVLNIGKAITGTSMAAFLGKTLEVAGVVMAAYAGGAFNSAADLTAPLGTLEEDYLVELPDEEE